MQSLWNSAESEQWNSSELEQRLYSARILGAEPDLGCSIGGAISVKFTEKDLFGEVTELIYVQAAGTDLANIEVAQLVPLRRDYLLRLPSLPGLSTRELQRQLRLAAEDPCVAPPTINAFLHAAVPAKYVDQASADRLLTVGDSTEEADLLAEIFRHSIKIILQAEQLGGWQPAPEFDLLRYGSGEVMHRAIQGKLEFAGEIALIIGAASGIGRATAKAFLAKGAAVAGLDLNPAISVLSDVPAFLGLPCDVTNERELSHALNQTVQRLGGFDILVLNTGFLPSTRKIVDLELSAWQHAMRINLDANFNLLRSCYPFLQESPRGGRIVVVSPQNIAPPGGGTAAYAAAKAALTELVRSAAAEWGMSRIRVQIVHPGGVFDTGIWTPEVLAQRARSRGMTVEEYRRHNFLQIEINSQDVAELVVTLCGSAFSKTTGAQIAIDGGSW
jgi:NAD(P)-dependent dehydrogenase (short-subunit alcohol dehydrogenase family)